MQNYGCLLKNGSNRPCPRTLFTSDILFQKPTRFYRRIAENAEKTIKTSADSVSRRFKIATYFSFVKWSQLELIYYSGSTRQGRMSDRQRESRPILDFDWLKQKVHTPVMKELDLQRANFRKRKCIKTVTCKLRFGLPSNDCRPLEASEHY